MLYIIGILGVGVFAITGVIAAAKERLDGFGVFVLAIVTGVGGGTIRDVLLQRDYIFWINDSKYLLVCVSAALLSYATVSLWIRYEKSLIIADAVAMSLFSAVGAQYAIDAGVSTSVVIVMAVLTSVGGGVIRDVLCYRPSMLFGGELYSVAAAIGGICVLLLERWGVSKDASIIIASIVCFIVRLSAIRWNICFPGICIKDTAE